MIRNTVYENKKSLIGICLVNSLIMTASLYVPYLNLLVIAICAWGIFTMIEVDIVYMLVFMLSFVPIFKINIGGFALFHVLIIIVLIRLLLQNYLKLPRRSGIAIIIFAIYLILNSFRANITESITMLCFLLVAALLAENCIDSLQLEEMVTFFALGIIYSSIIAMCGNYLPRVNSIINQARIRFDAGEYYYRFAGLQGNPNNYTMLLSVVLAAICILFIKNRARVWDYVFFVVLSVFGFMSVSQSFIIGYIIMLVLLFIFTVRTNVKRFIVVVFSIIVLLGLVYTFLDNETIAAMFFRLESGGVRERTLSDLTTGRSDLWMVYLNYFLSDWVCLFFGNGLGVANLSVGASHSYYIETIYYLGIIGGVLYVICLFCIFGKKRNFVHHTETYYYLPLIVFLIRALARNVILSEQLIFILLLCAVAILEPKLSFDEMTMGEKDKLAGKKIRKCE